MAINSSIADIRTDYKLKTLNENEIAVHPIAQFAKWWDEALKSEVVEINAMTLATVSKSGEPSARIMLLKTFDKNGFVFFSNYNSRKGYNLAENPKAALCFFWKELERQVRIVGNVKRISEEDSDTYFYSRPLKSRIGAWASPQSAVIESKNVLEQNVVKFAAQFKEDVPRPSHWGGYIVEPYEIEFWQGGSGRLHDRICYSLHNNEWKIERLAP